MVAKLSTIEIPLSHENYTPKNIASFQEKRMQVTHNSGFCARIWTGSVVGAKVYSVGVGVDY